MEEEGGRDHGGRSQAVCPGARPCGRPPHPACLTPVSFVPCPAALAKSPCERRQAKVIRKQNGTAAGGDWPQRDNHRRNGAAGIVRSSWHGRARGISPWGLSRGKGKGRGKRSGTRERGRARALRARVWRGLSDEGWGGGGRRKATAPAIRWGRRAVWQGKDQKAKEAIGGNSQVGVGGMLIRRLMLVLSGNKTGKWRPSGTGRDGHQIPAPLLSLSPQLSWRLGHSIFLFLS
jgi:hypothetical protein